MALFAVLVSACGASAADREPTAQQIAAVALADQNEAALDLTDDFAFSEMLDAETGEITTLADVATGDRPVLVWYWTPN